MSGKKKKEYVIYVLEENKYISTYCILLNKEALGLLQYSRCHHDLVQYFPCLPLCLLSGSFQTLGHVPAVIL